MSNIILINKNKVGLYFITTLSFVLLLGFSSCKDPKIIPKETNTSLLTQNNWLIEKYTSADNMDIAEGKINTNASILKQLEFQFRSINDVNTVKAIVIGLGQVPSNGTWQFTNAEKKILIDIPGLKDEFTLIALTKTSLILRPNEKVFPIVDNNTVVNMVFKVKI
jgi:hypothetical protein